MVEQYRVDASHFTTFFYHDKNPKQVINEVQRDIVRSNDTNNMVKLYKIIDHLFSGFDIIESQYTNEVLKNIDPQVMEKVKALYDDRKKNGYVQVSFTITIVCGLQSFRPTRYL